MRGGGSAPAAQGMSPKLALFLAAIALAAWNLLGSSHLVSFTSSSSSSASSFYSSSSSSPSVSPLASSSSFSSTHYLGSPTNPLLPHKRYFFYQPSGGFGNQRYILRWAIVAANALNRTLVVSPLAPHSNFWHGYNEWKQEELVPADRVLDATALSQAVAQGVEFIDDIPKRVIARAGDGVSIKVHVKGHWVDRRTKTKLLVYREHDIRELFPPKTNSNFTVMFWDKMSMWGCCMTDYGRDLAWYGRHIVFSRELKQLASQVMAPNTYNAVHIRRGDMTSRDRATAQLYYKNYRLDKFNSKLPLYIASNEQDRAWFGYLEGKFPRVIFFPELLQANAALGAFLDRFPSKMRNDVIGFVEILVCGNAKQWQGSKKSTFSAAMQAVRGNPAAKQLNPTFDAKPSSERGGRSSSSSSSSSSRTEEEEEEDDDASPIEEPGGSAEEEDEDEDQEEVIN